MKAKIGGKIIVTTPSKQIGLGQYNVEDGHVGKVTDSYDEGCYAKNPLWGDHRVGFTNIEFEFIEEGVSNESKSW